MAYLPPGLTLPVLGTFLCAFARSSFAIILLNRGTSTWQRRAASASRSAHLVLGQAYEQKGQYDLAISELKKATAHSPNSPLMLGALGDAYAAAGDTAEAEKLREDLVRRSSEQYVSPVYVALIFTGLRENDKALDWLDQAYPDRLNPLVFLKVDPELDPLRSNPRFRDLQRRIGLPL